MSDSRGTPCRRVRPSAITHAATIGSAEFLLPEISIFPLRRVPPRMRKLSMIWPFHWPQGPWWCESPLTGLSADPSADDQSTLGVDRSLVMGDASKHQLTSVPETDIAFWRADNSFQEALANFLTR